MSTQLRYRTVPKPGIRSTFKCQRRLSPVTLDPAVIPHLSMEDMFKIYNNTGIVLIPSERHAAAIVRKNSLIDDAMRKYWNRVKSPGRHQRYRRKLHLATKRLTQKMQGYFKMQAIYNDVTAQI